MDAIDLREIHRQLEELRIRCDYIEANQRNAESGTTACSAAGGGIEQVKTARSAGREPCLIEVLEYAKERRDYLSRFYKDKRCVGQRVEAENFIYWLECRIIEARRGDAGCVETPAG